MGERANRRAYYRARQEAKVQYSFMGCDDYFEARLIDLGEGGLCMESRVPVKTGVDIYVRIVEYSSDKDGFEAHRSFRGTVRWNKDMSSRDVTRYGIGVQYKRPTH